MRRPNQLFSERVTLSYDHAQLTQDTTFKRWTVPAGRSFRLDRALIINPTGLAVDASNFFNIKVKKGSTVMANRSTGTDALAADTFHEMGYAASDGDRVAAAGDVISIEFDETGTQTLPPGTVVIEGRLF
jgi:hypothetical protein